MAKMKPMPGNLVQSRVIGIPAALMQLRAYGKAAERGADLGVFKATEFLGNESNKVTPIEFGDLRRSKQTHYTGKGFDKKGMVSYNTPYAIYVHEDLTKWHASGTYAKFLQRTAWDKRAEINRIMRDEIAKSQMKADYKAVAARTAVGVGLGVAGVASAEGGGSI